MVDLTASELAIIASIEEFRANSRRPVVIALDGRSGVGKSTIAVKIAPRLGAVVVPGDDFYAGGIASEWRRLTAEEKASRVIDWRRLRAEALEPLRAGQPTSYYPFDWTTWAGPSVTAIELPSAEVVIVDGVYSARPELGDLIDLTVLIEMPNDAERRQRLVQREGAHEMDEWHAIWDEAEDYYFTRIRPPESFDLRVQSSG